MRTILSRTLLAAAIGVSAVATGCAPPPPEKTGDKGSNTSAAASAAEAGGMDALVAAARKEGRLNVIALPPDWANYGAVIDAFSKKYGIKVSSAQPDASSQDEITAAKQLKGTDRAPDVFDLGPNVALANAAHFAPYQVQTWAEIPAALKDSGGSWYSDYGGYMSIGYDASRVPAPTSVADLLKPGYKGKVALNGDPTQAGAAFDGVVAAALGSGGSADDVANGVDFFGKLKKAGNFLPVDPTPATIESGQTPVVFDWDYLNAAQVHKLKGKVDWKVVVPRNAVVGSYYIQAINSGAAHPAAARLWEEFLYSDDGQNLWLAGFARPVRAEAMAKSGKLDQTAFAKLPPATGTPVFLTTAQTDKAKQYIAGHWKQSLR